MSLATPPASRCRSGLSPDWVQEAAKTAPLVFDVGSVKRPIIDALYPLPPNYVPCHPIAGSERAGPAAARGDLFNDASVVLTPVAETDAAATATVRGYWQAIGATVTIETPEAHDERLALVSHLPHLVAFAFMEVAGDAERLAGAGGGFRDFTRIAAADAAIWTDNPARQRVPHRAPSGRPDLRLARVLRSDMG